MLGRGGAPGIAAKKASINAISASPVTKTSVNPGLPAGSGIGTDDGVATGVEVGGWMDAGAADDDTDEGAPAATVE